MNELNGDFISPQSVFYALMSNAENFRKSKTQLAKYFILGLNHFTAIQIGNPITILTEVADLAEIAEKKHQVVLMHNDSIQSNRSIIPIIKDCGTDECPRLICIPHVKNSTELQNWFCQNRQPRLFNINPKHGESGKGTKSNKGEEVSILLCSRKDAQELLNTAIGDKRISKKLFNFDEKHQKFIVFEDENTSDNTYHGYHVEDENEVPKEIQKLLRHPSSYTI